MEVYRKVDSPQFDYIQKKTAINCECGTSHIQSEMCANCFWKYITIPPECIPECQTCKEDTEKFGRLVKDNPKANSYEFSPDCFKACIWWDWFYNNRKMKCGCSCKDACTCGKIKHGEKKKIEKDLKKTEENVKKSKVKK